METNQRNLTDQEKLFITKRSLEEGWSAGKSLTAFIESQSTPDKKFVPIGTRGKEVNRSTD